ncbi:hypothetical protein BG004_006528, partial [Podila humilis]
VSFLHSFEHRDDYMDWEIGTHGIRIHFTDNFGKQQSATYLPEVASENNWTKEHAIKSLVRKGGYTGQITEKVLSTVKLQRYQSAKVQLGWKQYRAEKYGDTF